MKRSWPSLVARELQLPEWWKSRADSTALSTVLGKLEVLALCWWECEMAQPLEKTLEVSYQFKL